jgi:hypothetical protein
MINTSCFLYIGKEFIVDIYTGALNLTDSGLSGTLTVELVCLNQLIGLDVSGNHIGGTLPPERSQLSHLKNLSLKDYKLEGTVPSSWEDLLPHLLELDQSQNSIDSSGTSSLVGLPCIAAALLGDSYQSRLEELVLRASVLLLRYQYSFVHDES